MQLLKSIKSLQCNLIMASDLVVIKSKFFLCLLLIYNNVLLIYSFPAEDGNRIRSE